MQETLIRGADAILTMDDDRRELKNADILIKDGVIAAIGQGQRPGFTDADMRTIFDFSVELHRDRAVSDGVYQRAEQVLGPQGVVDLVAICGYYSLISMTINAFDVPDGDGPALPVLSQPPERMFR